MTARLLLGRQLRLLEDVDWTVVTGDEFEGAPPELEVDVVAMRREMALSDFSSFLALRRLFRAKRFDFVQTHTPKPSLLGLPAARLSRTPSIYTIHGSLYFKGNGRLANVAGWCFERWCCTWATRVVVQSREDEVVLPKVKICSAKKLSLVGNGIATAHYAARVEPAPLPGPRRDEGAADGADSRPVVLMVSRLVREKGCHDFLTMARRLKGRARFVHVGPFEADQRDAISPSEVDAAADIVTFVGAVEDVRPYLAAADIVVLPSYREGIPRAVMEAAAAGRPVVAYDIRGVREVIEPSSGLLVTRGDVEAFGDLVGELIADPERRRALGECCQRWVLDHFDEHDVVDRLEALYRELLPPSPPGPTAPQGVSSTPSARSGATGGA
jgi:glycosyltransferase involved in cell wall biosynthesis